VGSILASPARVRLPCTATNCLPAVAPPWPQLAHQWLHRSAAPYAPTVRPTLWLLRLAMARPHASPAAPCMRLCCSVGHAAAATCAAAAAPACSHRCRGSRLAVRAVTASAHPLRCCCNDPCYPAPQPRPPARYAPATRLHRRWATRAVCSHVREGSGLSPSP
jgi:hypothetical protein